MVYRSGDEERSAGAPLSDAVPADLRAAVDSGNQVWRYAPVPDENGEPGPTLLIGAPLPGDAGGGEQIELYYAFPLDQEEESLARIRATVIIVGVVLTLFVVGIGVLVTRLVVDPVRRAAGTAQRLAEGQLEQRMVVRGEDDLARLATSFNAMADSLQRQITQLEGLSQLQQRFTSDVSHELRTPLTTVQMAAEVLHEARSDFQPHVARSAELLRAELDRFEGLLTDLLEISRYDAGAAELDAEATDLGALVARVVAGMYALAGRHGVELVVNRPDEDVIAEVDARRVERILRNLVGNAIEHGAGRPVEITLAANPTAAAVTVRDLGVGLLVGGGPARVRPVLAGRPLPGPDGGRQRSGSVDQPRGRPAARRLAAGLGSAGLGRPVPAHAAADRRSRSDQFAPAAAPVGPAASRDPVVTRPAARGAALLAFALALPACSTVPSNSPTVQITQAPARQVDEIGIEPVAPEPGETPDDIVRGFIDAAASTRQGHPVARAAPGRPGGAAPGRTRRASRSSAPTTPRSRPSRAR